MSHEHHHLLGFVSINLIPTPVFRELGWVLGLGVSAALLLAMTLVPIFADRGPVPNVDSKAMNNIVSRFVDRIVAMSRRWSSNQPWWVIAFFAVFSIGVVYVAGQHRIETNFLTRLDADNVIRIDNDFFEHEYTGTQTLDVFISGDHEGAMIDDDTLRRMDEFERTLEAHPDIDQAISYMDVLRQTHRHLGGEGPSPLLEPQQPRVAAPGVGGGSELDQVLNTDKKHLTNDTACARTPNESHSRALKRGECHWKWNIG